MLKAIQVLNGNCVPLWLAGWIEDSLLTSCILESMGSNRMEMESAVRGWKKTQKTKC